MNTAHYVPPRSAHTQSEQSKCKTCAIMKQYPTQSFREMTMLHAPFVGFLGNEKYTNVIAYIALANQCHLPRYFDPANYCRLFFDFVKYNFNKICKVVEHFSEKTHHIYLMTNVCKYDETEHPHSFLLFDGNVDFHSYFLSVFPDDKWVRKPTLIQTHRKTHNDTSYANETRAIVHLKCDSPSEYMRDFHHALLLYPTALYVQHIVDIQLNDTYEIVGQFLLFTLSINSSEQKLP